MFKITFVVGSILWADKMIVSLRQTLVSLQSYEEHVDAARWSVTVADFDKTIAELEEYKNSMFK